MTCVTKSFEFGSESFGGFALKVHKLHEFVDLRSQHFDAFLVDLDSIWLVVGLDLRNGPRATPPSVEHLGELHSLVQHLVHGGVDRSFLDVFRHAHDKGTAIFEIRVEISLNMGQKR